MIGVFNQSKAAALEFLFLPRSFVKVVISELPALDILFQNI